jgi:gamma-glutamyl-gamma-aminobutyrate hydrolase PuuD
MTVLPAGAAKRRARTGIARATKRLQTVVEMGDNQVIQNLRSAEMTVATTGNDGTTTTLRPAAKPAIVGVTWHPMIATTLDEQLAGLTASFRKEELEQLLSFTN